MHAYKIMSIASKMLNYIYNVK